MTDRVLAIAAVLADDMRCSGCGHPKAEAWNPHSAGWYVVHEAECEGCLALERAAAGDKQARGEIKRWAVDERPASEELPPWTPGKPGHPAPAAPRRPSRSEAAVA